MTIEERAEQAVSLKNSGCNCCQAVLAALRDQTGLSEDQALTLASGFGGGMGSMEGSCGALVGDGWITKAAIAGREQVGRGRQGFVVRVYDDMLVIERREFGSGTGTSLGADWIMPFGKAPHPFARGELIKVIGEPQFPDGAKLVVENAQTAVKLSIPLANANPDSRVYAYEVEVNSDDSNPLYKAVYASGVNLSMGNEPNGGVTSLSIPKEELPRNKTLSFTVRPLSSLGTKGKPITGEYNN